MKTCIRRIRKIRRLTRGHYH